MKRFAVVVLFLGLGSMLSGCPIYDDDSGCSFDEDCPSDYVCDSLVGSCRPNKCTAPTQCPEDQTCSRAGKCVVGDCSREEIGCVGGFVCSPETGVWECVKRSSSGQGGAGGAESAMAGSGGVIATGGASSSGGSSIDATGGTSG